MIVDDNLNLTLSRSTKPSEVIVTYKTKDGRAVRAAPVQYDKNFDSRAEEHVDICELIKLGKHLATVLFPKEVRDVIITKTYQDKPSWLRIRLFYEGNETQVDDLLSIPWEYVYLPPEGISDPIECTKKDLDRRGYFLGLREDISIVHCLNSPDNIKQPLNRNGDQFSRLDMFYYSFLAITHQTCKAKDDDKALYNNFVGEYQKLTTFLDCKNISSHKPHSFKDNSKSITPDPYEIPISLQKAHVVHCTGHGEADILSVGDTLTVEELKNEFKLTDAPNIMALILVNCNSGLRASSITAKLHKTGVPIIIGMTENIDIPPAGRFIDGFYKALAAWPSDGLERAISYGRRSIFAEGIVDQTWTDSFGLPRLFLNTYDSALIPEKQLFGNDKLLQYFRVDIKKTARKLNIDNDLNAEFDNKLREWLKPKNYTPDRRWYLVSGKGGVGKSTQVKLFLRKWRQNQSKTPLFWHFCQPEMPCTGDPMVFIRDSLVHQLDSYYKDTYTQALPPEILKILGKDYKGWCRSGRYPLLTHNAEDAFRYFVLEPLRKLKIINEVLDQPDPVFIIDGLDFIPPTHHPNNSILHLMLNYKDDLDDLARFLITFDIPEESQDIVTGDNTEQAYEETVQKNDQLNTVQKAIFELTYHQGEVPDHVFKERTNQSVVPENENTGPPLFEKAKENFIDSGLLSYEDIQPVRTLDELFKMAIDMAKRKHMAKDSAYKEILVNRILDVMALAYEPLYACDVSAIIGLSYSESKEMEDLLEILKPFFIGANPYSDTLILLHDRLKQYILRDMDRGSTALIHELILEAFRPKYDRWEKISNWSDLMGEEWETEWKRLSTPCSTDHMSRYVKRYLAHHGYRSYIATAWRHFNERKERARKFLSLICDPGYRIVRLAEGGLEESLQDLRNGLRVLFTEHIHNLSPEEKTSMPIKKYNIQARLALERMLGTNDPASYQRRTLINLERKLREGSRKENRKILQAFLFDN